jgi:chlorobactene glucosyltransferase
MPILLAGALWAGLVAVLLLRAVRQFRAYHATSLATPGRDAGLPSVSIIVPVRNEIDNIGPCLDGLSRQTCLERQAEIIIVDDGSQDGTAAAIESAIVAGAPLRLIAAGGLPAGWVGKPHACWRGAALSHREWLCFIDADVRAAPPLVDAALAAAETQRLDMLSLQPLQELGSFWERVVMPAGLLMIACATDPPAVDDHTSAAIVANGQFLLVRRSVYHRVGGHAAVRAEICEDKALALRVRRAGFRYRVLDAEHLARTRMYRDFESLWEGLSKNAVDIMGTVSGTLSAAAAGFVFGWATVLLPLALGLALLRQPSLDAAVGCALALSGSAAVLAVQLGTARHFRIPVGFGLLLGLGYMVAAVLACRSVLIRLDGRVRWKGRVYDLRGKASPGPS